MAARLDGPRLPALTASLPSVSKMCVSTCLSREVCTGLLSGVNVKEGVGCKRATFTAGFPQNTCSSNHFVSNLLKYSINSQSKFYHEAEAHRTIPNNVTYCLPFIAE